jgi:hypothetical protein
MYYNERGYTVLSSIIYQEINQEINQDKSDKSLSNEGKS